MLGSLAQHHGVLYVARHARNAEVRTYDFDGARIGEGFFFGGQGGGRASADGIAVDADHRIWVADSASRAVRVFTVFGAELAGFGEVPGHAQFRDHAGPELDAMGTLGEPRAVAVDGVEDELRVLVGSGGLRRHALQIFDRSGAPRKSLRPRGDPDMRFQDVARVALRGRFAYACERGTSAVQVFRDDEFHFMFKVPRPRGVQTDPEPRAVHALSDGRVLVATSGAGASAVHVFEPSGRWIRALIAEGETSGSVFEPTDIAVDEGASDRRTRIAVIDLDGDRVQVFTLEGVCYGSIADLPRADV
jgi:hypothetical protein